MTAGAGGPAGRRDVTTVLRDLAWTIHRRVPDELGLDPLPTTELAVLKHVLDHPGATVGELARQLGLRQSNTSAAVRALVDRGLLSREASPADRRVTRLAVTAEAQSEHEAIAAAWSGSIRAALSHLAPEHVAAIEAAAAALHELDRALHEEQTA